MASGLMSMPESIRESPEPSMVDDLGYKLLQGLDLSLVPLRTLIGFLNRNTPIQSYSDRARMTIGGTAAQNTATATGYGTAFDRPMGMVAASGNLMRGAMPQDWY